MNPYLYLLSTSYFFLGQLFWKLSLPHLLRLPIHHAAHFSLQGESAQQTGFSPSSCLLSQCSVRVNTRPEQGQPYGCWQRTTSVQRFQTHRWCHLDITSTMWAEPARAEAGAMGRGAQTWRGEGSHYRRAISNHHILGLKELMKLCLSFFLMVSIFIMIPLLLANHKQIISRKKNMDVWVHTQGQMHKNNFTWNRDQACLGWYGPTIDYIKYSNKWDRMVSLCFWTITCKYLTWHLGTYSLAEISGVAYCFLFFPYYVFLKSIRMCSMNSRWK